MKIPTRESSGPQEYIDSPNQPVQPTSLYAEQLAERLHTATP